MDNHDFDEEAIFDAALRLTESEEVRAFLKSACGSQPEVRQRIERLLALSTEADNFFFRHALRFEDANRGRADLKKLASPCESPGLVINGRYRLLEKIGEGGCGTVFVAEQIEPIRREVALKIIKLGMDTCRVVKRFQAEYQTLALMDHPNISKVLDAGSTEAGRPFFVMELVRGDKITDYCRHNNPSIRDRLALYAQVCRAVQHAHQKGIIHRA